MKPQISLVAVTGLLFGCASTGVVPMDKDSYFIGKKDRTPGFGISLTIKAEVYNEANEFCNAKNLDVETLSLNVTPARPGQFGSTDLQFRCSMRGSVAKPLIREPDRIVEIRNR